MDEVIIGAPWSVSEDMIKTMNISKVLRGTHYGVALGMYAKVDSYELPKAAGIFSELRFTRDLSMDVILERAVANRADLIKRNIRKVAVETKYLTMR